MSSLDKVTVLIPTYNRHAYLKRLLKYYIHSEIVLNILIADSSVKPLDDELTELISSSGLGYLKFPPEVTPQKKILNSLGKISTEYVVICADDDLIVPTAIKDCISFMEQNPDFSIVQGVMCRHFLTKGRNGNTEFEWMPYNPKGRSVTFDNSSDRLMYHLRNYCVATYYGVHRTAQLRFIFEEMINTTSHGRMGEVLLSALTLIVGKLEILPIFYSSREMGNSIEQDLSTVPYFHTQWDFFLTNDGYEREYQQVADCLVRNLQRQTNLSKEEAERSAEDALNMYFDSVRERFGRSRRLFNLVLTRSHLKGPTRYMYWELIAVLNRLRGRVDDYGGLSKPRRHRRNLEDKPNFAVDIARIRESVLRSQIHFAE